MSRAACYWASRDRLSQVGRIAHTWNKLLQFPFPCDTVDCRHLKDCCCRIAVVHCTQQQQANYSSSKGYLKSHGAPHQFCCCVERGYRASFPSGHLIGSSPLCLAAQLQGPAVLVPTEFGSHTAIYWLTTRVDRLVAVAVGYSDTTSHSPLSSITPPSSVRPHHSRGRPVQWKQWSEPRRQNFLPRRRIESPLLCRARH
jgi:hypothetical protein